MPYYVYILYSPTLDSYYRGQTTDIQERVRRHNSGHEKSTKHGVPWNLVWMAEKETRSEAIDLERKLKNLSVKRLKEFMEKYRSEPRRSH